jgi:hypothetical protein
MSEHLGNDFNYLCPNCKRGDRLSVMAYVQVGLTTEGSVVEDGDHEWNEQSGAACKCRWTGHVGDFIKLPEGEGKLYACQDCETEFYENQLNPAKDLSERIAPGDVYTDVECPSCGALCFPI